MLLLMLVVGSSPIATEPPPPPNPCPVASRMSDRMRIGGSVAADNACQAEMHLHRAGWSDAWVAGALANAWHESGWSATIPGDHGRALGFWQLRDDGLGKGMGELRKSVSSATARVVRSATRQRMDVSGDDPEEAARQFCYLIMRPSDKVLKGELRARTAARLSADNLD